MKSEDIAKGEIESYKKESMIREWAHYFDYINRSSTGGLFTKIGFKTTIPEWVVRDDVPLFSDFARSIIRGEKKFFVDRIKDKVGVHDKIAIVDFTPSYVGQILKTIKPTGDVKILMPFEFKFQHILKNAFEWKLHYPNHVGIYQPPVITVGDLDAPIFALLEDASKRHILIFDSAALHWRQVKQNEPLLVNFERQPNDDVIMEICIIVDLAILDSTKIKVIEIVE